MIIGRTKWDNVCKAVGTLSVNGSCYCCLWLGLWLSSPSSPSGGNICIELDTMVKYISFWNQSSGTSSSRYQHVPLRAYFLASLKVSLFLSKVHIKKNILLGGCEDGMEYSVSKRKVDISFNITHWGRRSGTMCMLGIQLWDWQVLRPSWSVSYLQECRLCVFTFLYIC